MPLADLGCPGQCDRTRGSGGAVGAAPSRIYPGRSPRQPWGKGTPAAPSAPAQPLPGRSQPHFPRLAEGRFHSVPVPSEEAPHHPPCTPHCLRAPRKTTLKQILTQSSAPRGSGSARAGLEAPARLSLDLGTPPQSHGGCHGPIQLFRALEW